MKDILVIGNGSDCATGLPTRYVDFMSIINIYDNAMHNCGMTNLAGFPEKFSGTYVEKYARQYLNRRLGWTNSRADPEIKKLEPLFTAKRTNFWLLLYGAKVEEEREMISRGESIGNWIDCEKEMEDVLLTLNEAMEHGKIIYGDKLSCKKKSSRELKQILEFLNESHHRIKNFDQLILWLERDLYQFQYALELYLVFFVNAAVRDGMINKRDPVLEQIKADKVISFNYTSTYQLLYDPNVEIDYIHGVADRTHTIETSNIVLGIENEMLDKDDTKRVLFATFQKSWQRLMRETGTSYKNWLNSNYNLVIYGHSLGTRDRSILRELLLSEYNRSTKIYCLNRYTEEQYKKNLILILGGDALKQKLSNKMIQFVNLQET